MRWLRRPPASRFFLTYSASPIYGVVEPATGEQYYQEFSQLNHNCFQDFLNGFAQKYSDYFNLIIRDNGSFHKALLLDWHDHVMPIYLPAYSPELNPIERLWKQKKTSSGKIIRV